MYQWNTHQSKWSSVLMGKWLLSVCQNIILINASYIDYWNVHNLCVEMYIQIYKYLVFKSYTSIYTLSFEPFYCLILGKTVRNQWQKSYLIITAGIKCTAGCGVKLPSKLKWFLK